MVRLELEPRSSRTSVLILARALLSRARMPMQQRTRTGRSPVFRALERRRAAPPRGVGLHAALFDAPEQIGTRGSDDLEAEPVGAGLGLGELPGARSLHLRKFGVGHDQSLSGKPDH